MKNPANSNIYEVSARSVLDAYAGYIDGDPEDLLLVVSASAPSDEARSALFSTAQRLGYGKDVAWLHLNGEVAALGARELMMIVEGLDPCALIALDEPSTTLLAQTYRCTVASDSFDHIFGRPTVTFVDFAAMLEDDDRKQRAWALLKHLALPSTPR